MATEDETRQLKDQNAGLLALIVGMTSDKMPYLLSRLAGELHAAREELEAEKKKIEKTVESMVDRQTVQVGKWIQFIRSKPEYLKGAGGGSDWPTYAAALHSSLLRRMLKGEAPMSDEEYAKWKAKH